MVPTLLILSALVFLSVRFIPGDIIDALESRMDYLAAPLDREQLERVLGLDVPIHVQYVRWVGDILVRGTLGDSLLGKDTVEAKIRLRAGPTFQLGLMALVIAMVIALPVGIFSAIRQDTAGDYAGRTVAVLGLATPNFWLALMVIIYPALWWDWSPPIILVRFLDNPWESLGRLHHPQHHSRHRPLGRHDADYPYDDASRCCARTTSARRGPRGCASGWSCFGTPSRTR